MFLTGNVLARTAMKLGGPAIADDGSWRGKWKLLKPGKNGSCIVKVPAASAAIVRMCFENRPGGDCERGGADGEARRGRIFDQKSVTQALSWNDADEKHGDAD